MTSLSADTPLDNPAVLHWAENTGPFLGFKARAVLREICRYAHPDHGRAFPSQERIARSLDTTRQTICNQVKIIEAAGLVHMGQLDRNPGKQYVYTFTGVQSTWIPAPKPEVSESLDVHRLRRIRELEAENAELRRGQEENSQLPVRRDMDPETGEILPMLSDSEQEISSSSYSFISDEDQEKTTTTNTESIHNVKKNPTVDPAVSAKVREHWPDLKASWNRGINSAITWYQQNPDDLDAQVENILAVKEGPIVFDALDTMYAPADAMPRQSRPAQVQEDTWTEPADADPAAKAVWELVLEYLSERVPSPTFDQWLKRSVGFTKDEQTWTFTVAVPNLLSVSWLERRMYEDLSAALAKAVGHEMLLTFEVVQASAGEDLEADGLGPEGGPDDPI